MPGLQLDRPGRRTDVTADGRPEKEHLVSGAGTHAPRHKLLACSSLTGTLWDQKPFLCPIWRKREQRLVLTLTEGPGSACFLSGPALTQTSGRTRDDSC